MPYTTPTDVTIQTLHNIIKVLQQEKPLAQLAHILNDQLDAIKQIAKVFKNHIKQQEPKKTQTNNQPVPPKLPSVPTTKTQKLPRVLATPIMAPTHRYPTRNVISRTQHEANHVERILTTAANTHIYNSRQTKT
jgi:hypothetical protein